jgi:hypothetical protein
MPPAPSPDPDPSQAPEPLWAGDEEEDSALNPPRPHAIRAFHRDAS